MRGKQVHGLGTVHCVLAAIALLTIGCSAQPKHLAVEAAPAGYDPKGLVGIWGSVMGYSVTISSDLSWSGTAYSAGTKICPYEQSMGLATSCGGGTLFAGKVYLVHGTWRISGSGSFVDGGGWDYTERLVGEWSPDYSVLIVQTDLQGSGHDCTCTGSNRSELRKKM